MNEDLSLPSADSLSKCTKQPRLLQITTNNPGLDPEFPVGGRKQA